MDEDALAGLEPRIVEQHVLDGAERDRRAGRIVEAHAVGHLDDEPGRHGHEFAREAVEMEAHHAGDVLAEVVAALAAGPAAPAGQGAVHHDAVARLQVRHALADGTRSRPTPRRPTVSGSLRLAKAMPRKPQTSMKLSPTARTRICDLAGSRGGRRLDLADAQVAIAEELEGLHGYPSLFGRAGDPSSTQVGIPDLGIRVRISGRPEIRWQEGMRTKRFQ